MRSLLSFLLIGVPVNLILCLVGQNMKFIFKPAEQTQTAIAIRSISPAQHQHINDLAPVGIRPAAN